MATAAVAADSAAAGAAAAHRRPPYNPVRLRRTQLLRTHHSLLLSLCFFVCTAALRLPAAMRSLPQYPFGRPSHWTRRSTATKFWAADLSCGAGTISSPVLLEHPKNVSECAMMSEAAVTELAKDAPPWLLLSVIGIATRELASRKVQNEFLPVLLTSDEAQPKARRLAQNMRQNLDDRIQRMLRPAGYGNAERLISRFVSAEVDDLKGTIRGLDDLVTHEVTQAVLEVAEAEIAERFQSTVGALVQLNKTAAERDLDDIMRRADMDGNQELTLDELYELLSGQPFESLDPQGVLAPLAREVVVLKSPQVAKSRWERWGSLLFAPPIREVSRAAEVMRRTAKAIEGQLDEAGGRALQDVAREATLAFQEALEATERQEKLIRAEAMLSQRWLSDVTSEVTRQMGIVDLDGYSKGSRAEAMMARAEKAAAMEEAQALAGQEVSFFGRASGQAGRQVGGQAGRQAGGRAGGKAGGPAGGQQPAAAPSSDALQHRWRKPWRWLRRPRRHHHHDEDGSSAEAAAAAAARDADPTGYIWSKGRGR